MKISTFLKLYKSQLMFSLELWMLTFEYFISLDSFQQYLKLCNFQVSIQQNKKIFDNLLFNFNHRKFKVMYMFVFLCSKCFHSNLLPIKCIAVSEFDLKMFWSKNVILSHNRSGGGRVAFWINLLELLKHDFK